MVKFIPPQQIITDHLVIRKIKSEKEVNNLLEAISEYFYLNILGY